MPAALQVPLILSIVAALATVGLKTLAWYFTGSVGLLSDALESLINLVAALLAYFAVRYAARPVDASHTYGHEKIEYFSSGLEGGMIFAAAAGIGWVALERLVHPRPLEPLTLGLILSLIAAVINAIVGVILVRAGQKHSSIILEADGKHLLTDVWTSLGVFAGLTLVAWTGVEWLDPVIALLVAGCIVWTAVDLMRRSFDGLMDRALPDVEVLSVRRAIEERLPVEMHYHALRTRRAGTRRFADFHLLVPGIMSVQRAHEIGEDLEEAIHAVLPGIEVTVHIEPIEEERSWQDSALLGVERDSLRSEEHPVDQTGRGVAHRPDPG